jgi:hypothetical protein
MFIKTDKKNNKLREYLLRKTRCSQDEILNKILIIKFQNLFLF